MHEDASVELTLWCLAHPGSRFIITLDTTPTRGKTPVIEFRVRMWLRGYDEFTKEVVHDRHMITVENQIARDTAEMVIPLASVIRNTWGMMAKRAIEMAEDVLVKDDALMKEAK
jgi:hypothetical protein